MTIFSLRFTGGPLDGRTQPTETPAYEYRVVGGVYRRSRTHSRSATDGEPVIVYAWRPEEAERWHVPASRDADWVKAAARPFIREREHGAAAPVHRVSGADARGNQRR